MGKLLIVNDICLAVNHRSSHFYRLVKHNFTLGNSTFTIPSHHHLFLVPRNEFHVSCVITSNAKKHLGFNSEGLRVATGK